MVRQCLAKDPDERSQTAHDVKLHLQWVLEGGSQAGVPAPVAKSRRQRERAFLVSACAGFTAAAVAVTLNLNNRPVPQEPIRFQFEPPSSIQVLDAPNVSPDGRTIAFSATDSTGVTRIWLRPLGSLHAHADAGHRGHHAAVLVAGQPLPRVRRGRQAQEGAGHGRAADRHLRCALRV